MLIVYSFLPTMALNIYYSDSFKIHWQLFMAILSKPLGQQTRRDIILRLRKENEKGYEQRQTEEEEDHTLFPLLEETAAPIVCALKVIISSHWFSQSLIR